MRIGIIGCGVAGMAAAIALSRDGHDIEVLERFSESKPVGAGLLLQPSGIAVLERLSLADAAGKWGAPVQRLYGRTVSGRTVMNLRYDDIAPGARGLGIHRGALFAILHDALIAGGARLQTGFEVERIENFEKPRLCAADGRVAGPFELVLDCAGAHHSICAKLGMRSRNAPYEWCALWTICPDRTGAFQGALQQVYERASLMIGILPVGRAPQSRFEGDHVAFFWSLQHSDVDAQRAEGLEALKMRVRRAWPEAEPVLNEVRSFDDLSLATYCDARMQRFHTGRVLALGDAAHATSPQLGQGANLALIDAFTLAYALRELCDVDRALTMYERLRRPHVQFYQLASRALTPLFQSDSVFWPAVRDACFDVLGRMPVTRSIARTTLAGVRRFPWGRWTLPG